jgi:hypothetical protein
MPRPVHAGGKKGLIVNSRNICQGKNRARAKLKAHNGRALQDPPGGPRCGLQEEEAQARGHRRG